LFRPGTSPCGLVGELVRDGFTRERSLRRSDDSSAASEWGTMNRAPVVEVKAISVVGTTTDAFSGLTYHCDLFPTPTSVCLSVWYAVVGTGENFEVSTCSSLTVTELPRVTISVFFLGHDVITLLFVWTKMLLMPLVNWAVVLETQNGQLKWEKATTYYSISLWQYHRTRVWTVV
jgi:hypothetical protein